MGAESIGKGLTMCDRITSAFQWTLTLVLALYVPPAVDHIAASQISLTAGEKPPAADQRIAHQVYHQGLSQ